MVTWAFIVERVFRLSSMGVVRSVQEFAIIYNTDKIYVPTMQLLLLLIMREYKGANSFIRVE